MDSCCDDVALPCVPSSFFACHRKFHPIFMYAVFSYRGLVQLSSMTSEMKRVKDILSGAHAYLNGRVSVLLSSEKLEAEFPSATAPTVVSVVIFNDDSQGQSLISFKSENAVVLPISGKRLLSSSGGLFNSEHVSWHLFLQFYHSANSLIP